MLEITIPETEMFDNSKNEFINIKQQTLQLEHSLISLSKWEAKWKKPFVGNKDIQPQEFVVYIRCMCITPKVDPMVFEYIPTDIFKKIKDYITTDQTASKVYDRRKNTAPHANENITSELIYYWMIYHGIPFECEKWHLSRLLMLIRICAVKGSNEQMSMNEIFAENRRLHNMRKGGKGPRR